MREPPCPGDDAARSSSAVRIHVDDAFVDATPGTTIFECGDRLGVRIPTSCHGRGSCRECLVEVIEGAELLSPPSAEEEHLRGGFRLACRARAESSGGTIRCRTLRRGELRIESSGERRAADFPPDPAVSRSGDGILIDGERIAVGDGITPNDGRLLGAAIDLGTTTVVVRLVDLETGALVASQAFENPQRFAGSDVMARIAYDTSHPGRLLQRTLLAHLGHVLDEMAPDPSAILEIVVAGNSTMRDLFFGLDVHGIGQRPYRSLVERELHDGLRTSTALSLPARRLRLPTHPAARAYGLPLVSGHVGADAAAGLLAIDLPHEDELVAIIDIGTNTEIVLGSRDRAFAASCPAGPAFEGGAISRGLPALEGAIEGVLLRDDGSIETRTIGDAAPLGICGSGLVELLGELLRTGRMDEYGRFIDDSDRFVVDAAHDIFLTEEDISQLAQAKGANVAGLRIVLEAGGVTIDDVDRFYLAGGFASRLPLDAARRIGFIPDVPDAKLHRVGNTSVEGATIALLSASRRRELEAFVQRITHVELETQGSFFDHFVDGCLFRTFGERGE